MFSGNEVQTTANRLDLRTSSVAIPFLDLGLTFQSMLWK